MVRYQRIAHLLLAIENCQRSGNGEWEEKHRERVGDIVKEGPSGAGWDLGTKLDWDRSSPERLVFFGEYHHMDEGGGYAGWTAHRVMVRPSLAFGMEISISGRDRNQIKGYLYDMFHAWLSEEEEDK